MVVFEVVFVVVAFFVGDFEVVFLSVDVFVLVFGWEEGFEDVVLVVDLVDALVVVTGFEELIFLVEGTVVLIEVLVDVVFEVVFTGVGLNICKGVWIVCWDDICCRGGWTIWQRCSVVGVDWENIS